MVITLQRNKKIKYYFLYKVKIIDAAKIAIKNRIKEKETMCDFVQ